MRKIKLTCAAIGAAMVLGGCGMEGADDEAIASAQSALATQISSAGSENVVTTPVLDSSNRHVVVVGYAGEDPDPTLLSYNNNSQQIFRNASRMSWSRVNVEANTMTGGTVRPPAGWAAFVGEPAITRNRSNPNMVYLTNVAIPNSKYPTGGIDGFLTTNASGYCGYYLGGACVARSTDDGRTFTVSASDCLANVTTSCPKGNPYLGSDLETSPEGRVYAAYLDNSGHVDVYMAPSPTGAFTKLLRRPAILTSSSSPRIKYGAGALYLLVESGVGSLYLTRYNGGASTTGLWTTPVLVGSVPHDDLFLGNRDRYLHMTEQYDLDIGLNDQGGTEVRVAYIDRSPQPDRQLKVARCTTGSTITCTRPAAWATAGSGTKIDPAITFVPVTFPDGTRLPWAVSWYDRRSNPSGSTVELWRGALSDSQLSAVRQEPSQEPCPSTSAHWTDYDRMAAGTDGFTLRGFSNSGTGTCTQARFISSPVRASLSSWQQ